MVLRPRALIQGGVWREGFEVVLADGRVMDVRPRSGPAKDGVLSAAFVNAHSHLEYRGMQDVLEADDYWLWIGELTRRKANEQPDDVRQACHVAAMDNRATGVGLIAEHSDRPYAAHAMRAAGLRGKLWQEVITLFEYADPGPKLDAIRAKAFAQADALGAPVGLTPHASYTVDTLTLRRWAAGQAFSIHVAETELERRFFRDDEGPIADTYRAYGIPHPGRELSAVTYLDRLGLARPGAQFVHLCDVTPEEITLLAQRGVTIAHCPRSNRRLRCPSAPVAAMLQARLRVGLGMDSPASSGPIDFFAEMRAVRQVLAPEVVWYLATRGGAASLGREGWDVIRGSTAPLIWLDAPECASVGDLIDGGQPSWVRWVEPSTNSGS